MANLLLKSLRPELIQLAVRHQVICQHEGIRWMLVQAFRTPEEQLRLYKQGREKLQDGSWVIVDKKLVVTDALPEHDPHCRRAAYDIAILVNGKIDWNAIDLYKQAGQYGKEVGLGWGGDFKNIYDYGHFELKNWRELPALINYGA